MHAGAQPRERGRWTDGELQRAVDVGVVVPLGAHPLHVARASADRRAGHVIACPQRGRTRPAWAGVDAQQQSGQRPRAGPARGRQWPHPLSTGAKVVLLTVEARPVTASVWGTVWPPRTRP